MSPCQLPPSSFTRSCSQSHFTAELFRCVVWLQPCVCAAEWPLRAPVSDVALSMRRMSLTSVQLLSERVAPQPLTPRQGEERRERETEGRTEEGDKGAREEGCAEIRRKPRVWERKKTNGGGDLSQTVKQERGNIVDNRR